MAPNHSLTQRYEILNCDGYTGKTTIIP